MRRLRNFSILLFIVSVALFLAFQLRARSHKDSSGLDIFMGSGTIEASVTDSEDVLLADVTARDSRDGDVTDSLVVEKISTFLRPSTRIITYAAFDKENHVTRAERELVYTDYEAPKFTITEPLVFSAGTTEILAHVSVADCLDGDLTDSVKILSNERLMVDVPGNYEIKLQAANSAGDVETLPVTVKILEEGPGELQIFLSDYVVYVPAGGEFDPLSLVKEVKIGGTKYPVVPGAGSYENGVNNPAEVTVGTNYIHVDDTVDRSTPGDYRVTYSMTIEKGNGTEISGETTLYVVVR